MLGTYLLSCALHARSISSFQQLSETLFLSDERPAYNFVLNFYNNYNALPSIQAMQENGFQIPDAPDSFEYYLQRCKNRAAYNAVLSLHPPLREAAIHRDGQRITEIIKQLNDQIGQISARSDSIAAHVCLASRMEKYRENQFLATSRAIPFGWPTLDEATGGLTEGGLISFVARPKVGKTHFVLRTANNAWNNGFTVLFFHLEMTDEEMIDCLIGIRTGINPAMIKKYRVSHWSLSAIENCANDLNNGQMFEFVNGAKVEDLNRLKMIVQMNNPDLVVIDGAYLLNLGKRYFNLREKYVNLATDLRNISLDLGKTFLTSWQLNRATDKKKNVDDMDLGDIGETDAIAQSSTQVIGFGIQHKANLDRRRVKLIAQRSGVSGVVFDVKYEFNPVCFDEIPRQMDRQEESFFNMDHNDLV